MVAVLGDGIPSARARPAPSNDDLPEPDTPATTTTRGPSSSAAAVRIVAASSAMRSSRPKYTSASASVSEDRPANGRRSGDVFTDAASSASSAGVHSCFQSGIDNTPVSPARRARVVSHTSNGSTVENSRGRCLPLRQSLMRCGEIDIPAAEHPDDAARNVGLPARTNSRASASPNAASRRPTPLPATRPA